MRAYIFTVQVQADDCTEDQARALLDDSLQSALDNGVIDDYKIL